MLNVVSKLLFTLSGLAVVSAIAYGLAVDERSGVAIFLSVAVAALLAGTATSGNAVPDFAPPVPEDAPPPQRRATTVGSAPRGSAWPLVAAGAVTLLFVGAAIGPAMVLVGVVAVLAGAGGWFSRVWTEDPTWVPGLRERVSDRLVFPFALPIGTFLLAAFIAISVSRVLLAISKNAAALLAIVAASAILAGCAWIAARPRIRPSAVASIAALAGVSMVGAGIAGAVSGERHFEKHGGHGGHHEEKVVHLVAEEVAFDKSRITAPAGEKVVIEFENLDDVYHNVAIYTGDAIDAKPVFNGDGFVGEDERVYELRAPPPGTYIFVCDFHVNMKGEFVSEAH